MPQNVPYSVQDIMDEIYVAVDNDPTSSTDSTQDEWLARLRLINMGISAWERQDVNWKELWNVYTYPTPVAASQSFVLTNLADYRRLLGGFVTFTDTNGNVTLMDVIRVDEGQYFSFAGQRKCYLVGNASGGWTFNFTFPITATDALVGQTLTIPYYKSALKMAVATDKPEMSDPSYLVNYVAYKKNFFNGRTDIGNDYSNDAQEAMDNMRVRNETPGPNQDNRIADTDIIRDGSSFGF